MLGTCVFAIMRPLNGLKLKLCGQSFRKVPIGTLLAGQFHLPPKVPLVWTKSGCIAERFFFSSLVSRKYIYFS